MKIEKTDDFTPAAPVLKKKRGISFIWVLPIIAACIGGWLVYKAVSEAGIPVEVILDSAEGLQAGKTKVMYKGIEIAKVEKITVSPDLRSVSLHFELPKRSEKYLNTNTMFWLVKPRVSLSGVSGLGTLLSGSYLEVKPQVGGTPTRVFTALREPPPKDETDPGLLINLRADRLGSLNRGAPVYFRQIKVGEVQEHRINKAEDGVVISVYIEEPYKHLVRRKTRFWNASGIHVEAGLTGVKIQTESVATMLGGGIAFYTPEDGKDSPPSKNGDDFPLFPDFDAAEAGIPVTLHLRNSTGIKENKTPIILQGIEIGIIKKIKIGKDLTGVSALAEFDPRVSGILNTGAVFWRVKPRFGLTGISDLTSLISGEYITLRPGKGAPSDEFDVLEEPPILSTDVPGLHFRFHAKDKGSIDRGTKIMYKKVAVGHVQACHLDKNGDFVVIDAYIEPQYAHLVRQNTRFWNASGLELKAGVSGFKFKTESAASLLLGGISFFTPTQEPRRPQARNGAVFPLYEDMDAATENGKLLKADQHPGLRIVARTRNLDSITEGSPVLYNRVKVGEVEMYDLAPDNDRDILIQLRVEPQYAHLVRQNTRFWNASGIKIRGSLSGIEIKSESIKTILNGGIAFFTPEPAGEAAVEGTVFSLFPDEKSAKNNSFPISIVFEQATGLQPGAPIRYQDVTVGRVTDIVLRAGHEDGVEVRAELHGDADFMAREGTVFWVVGPALGIVKTENLDTLLTGRYLRVRPGGGRETTRFTGAGAPPPTMPPGLKISVVAESLGSVRKGNPVYYRQIPVGSVLDYSLSDEADKVVIHLNIEPRYASLVREDSKFWNASGINVKAGIFSGVKIRTESLESIIAGGIAFATPETDEDGNLAPEAENGRMFTLHAEPEPLWLRWSPKIPLPAGPTH